MVSTTLFVIGVLLVAFVPSLYYMVRVRDSERYGREPYRRLIIVFAYGAVVAVVISIVLEVAIVGNLEHFERLYALGDEHFVGAVVIAPVVEEFAKALGLVFVMGYFLRAEDGIIYGVAAGLGFAATENLLYELSALEAGGLIAYFVTAIIRSISSTLLHASASGVAGLGIAEAQVRNRAIIYAAPYYIVAVLMHAIFNFVAGLTVTHEGIFGIWTPLISLLAPTLFAIVAFNYARQRIAMS
jgi:RsiW-degrading membrane proteinase PrsW (M82 family)